MISYKKPDLKAPRFRPKKHNLLNDDFCKKIKSKGGVFETLTNKQIKDVITSFNQNIWESVIEHRDGVELLEQLGYIFIGTCQRAKSNNTNIKSSLQYGVKVQHQNWESDQHLAKIFYTNFETKYRFRFHEMWGFTALRDFKRSVARAYPTEWKKYVVVDNFVKISKLFRSHIIKDKIEKETELLLEHYDEFDMT
jgi:hypothetical protein